MFSKRLKHLRRSITFRLTGYYVAMFVLCLLLGLAMIDRGLWIVLKRSDRNFLHSQYKELAIEYKEGIESLRKDNIGSKHSSVSAVRIATQDNRTLAFFGLDPSFGTALEHVRFSASKNIWTQIPLHSEFNLDVTQGKLPDGNIMQVALTDRVSRQVMRHFERVSAGALLPMLLLAACGGAFLASRTLRPVRELNAAVRTIVDTGRTDARLQTGNTAGELRDLVAAFNAMLGRIDALIQTLKGTLDNVAHDLRTPLSRLRGIAEIALQNDSSPQALRDALADCIEESERVATLLNTIMDITEVEAGAMKLVLQPVSLSALALEIAELYQHVAEEKGVTLASTSSTDATVLADANRLRQAIANLVDNAVKYTPPGGRVLVSVRTSRGEPALMVEDTGVGIPAEEQSRIWERLYRSDRSRSERGLGLGLSLVRAIMHAHHGRAELLSSPGCGSCFTLSFPNVSGE